MMAWLCRSHPALVFAALLLASCDKEIPPLHVGDWGPRSTVIGSNPNPQPDGGLGIWIEVSGGEGPNDVQIIFDGVPLFTAFYDRLATTSVPKQTLAQPGNKEIILKQISTDKSFPVGVFVVMPAP